MDRKSRKSMTWWIGASVALMLVLAPAGWLAQDEDSEEKDRDAKGTIFAEAGLWISKPNGLGFVAASQTSVTNPFFSTPLPPNYGTESQVRWRTGYSFGNVGRIVGTWYGHSAEYSQIEATPGNFVFGELTAMPLFAGYLNDGLADAFTAKSSASTRDLRLDFYRTFIDSPKVRADWFVGLRRVQHNRGQQVAYSALVPDLPPLGPPLCGVGGGQCPDVLPLPDTVLERSTFTGRGVDAGIEFEFPFWNGRLRLESGFSAAALLADIDTEYFSTTFYYSYEDPNTGELIILGGPYDDAFGGTRPGPGVDPLANVDFVTRVPVRSGISSVNSSNGSFVLDGYIGIRSNVWRTMELFVGYRSAYYADVGAEVRPIVSTAATGVTLDQSSGEIIGLNVQSSDTKRFSVTLEGLYAGLAYRF